MNTQIKSWGNSQAIRLTKELLEVAGMSANDTVEVVASDGVITIRKKARHISLEERAGKFGGNLNLSGELNWTEPEGKEVW